MAASVHTVRVGCSLQGTPSKSFHSLRYNFKPESIVSGGVGSLNVLAGTDGASSVQVELPSTHHDRPHYFSGTQNTSKDVECVLVWDEERQCYMLERLSSGVRLNSSRSKPSPMSSSAVNGALSNHKRASSAPVGNLDPLTIPKKRKPTSSKSPSPEETENPPRKRHHSEIPNNINIDSTTTSNHTNSHNHNHNSITNNNKTFLKDDRFEEYDDHEAFKNARSLGTPPRNPAVSNKLATDRSNGIASTPQARRMSPLDVIRATHRSSPLASPSNAAAYPSSPSQSSNSGSDSESESDMDMFAATLNEGLSRASQPV